MGLALEVRSSACNLAQIIFITLQGCAQGPKQSWKEKCEGFDTVKRCNGSHIWNDPYKP